jgi:hypothetical protein
MNEKRYLRLEMCLSSTCNRRNVCLSGAGGRIVACLKAHTVVCVKAPGRVMRVVTGVYRGVRALDSVRPYLWPVSGHQLLDIFLAPKVRYFSTRALNSDSPGRDATYAAGRAAPSIPCLPLLVPPPHHRHHPQPPPAPPATPGRPQIPADGMRTHSSIA